VTPGYEAPASHSFIRGPRKSDQSFVAATWCKQMGAADKANAKGPKYGLIGTQIDRVLERDDTRALIRHAPGDRDAIYGFVVFAEGVGVPLLHFVYVRKDHRGKGYGADLLRSVGVDTPLTAFVWTCRGPSAPWMVGKYKAASNLPLAEFLA
jgi:GNAT superfamily N-acetyltransferase